MSELKPCPFCNMPAASITSKIDGKEYYSCLNVDCPNGSWFTADEWNTRPIEDALTARIAELEAERRWIPVGERLPEEFTPVLTFSKDNDKPVTAILAAGFWWSNVDDAGFWSSNVDWALNVTHWMPLPQPPEVK